MAKFLAPLLARLNLILRDICVRLNFDEGLVLDKIIHNDQRHRRKMFAEHTLIGFAKFAFISEVVCFVGNKPR